MYFAQSLGGQRELEPELRRLERERQLGCQPERVECRQPGSLEIIFVQNPGFYRDFVCFCQPPSILPISFRLFDNAIYLFTSSISISHAICNINFNISNESEALVR